MTKWKLDKSTVHHPVHYYIHHNRQGNTHRIRQVVVRVVHIGHHAEPICQLKGFHDEQRYQGYPGAFKPRRCRKANQEVNRKRDRKIPEIRIGKAAEGRAEPALEEQAKDSYQDQHEITNTLVSIQRLLPLFYTIELKCCPAYKAANQFLLLKSGEG